MSATDTVALVGAIAAPLCAAVATIFGAAIGNRRGEKQAAKTASKLAESTATKAKIAAEEAATEARRAVTADWESYTGLLLKRLEAVEARSTTAERRIDSAEARAVVAEERAIRWESLYRIAVTHMRELIKWASDVSHMSDMPPAPAELISDL